MIIIKGNFDLSKNLFGEESDMEVSDEGKL